MGKLTMTLIYTKYPRTKTREVACKLFVQLSCFFLVVAAVLAIPLGYSAQHVGAQATGMTETQQKLFKDYEIRYFSEVDCPPETNTGGASGAGAGTLEGGSNPEIAFNFFVSKGLGDVQAAAMVGNFMAESTTSINPEIQNNIGAYGIAQWLGGRKSALLAKPDYNTLGVQLNHAWEELTGAYKARVLDPMSSTSDLATATRIVLERYEIPCLPGSAACDAEMNGTANKPGRLSYAQQALASFGTGATTNLNGLNISANPAATALSPSGGGTFCTSGLSTGIVSTALATGAAKSVIDTALKYAWPFSVRDLGYDQNADAKPEFQSSSASKYTYAQALTDCTIFVATVMRDSGADPNFPIGTTGIRSYLLANEGTKYQIIYQPRLEDLQPGDILQNLKSGSSGSGSWSGHIALYLGPTTTEAGTFLGADASKYTRVPGLLANVDSMVDGHPTSIAARLIQ